MEKNTVCSSSVRQRLEELKEPKFQKFSSSLIPNVPKEKIIGVRLPLLRKMARTIARGDWKVYLETASDNSFEEIMLQGMVIGYVKAELPVILSLIDGFLPKIDNWSVCDSFCSGLKITRDYPEEMWNYIGTCLTSEEEYTIRFAIVMIICYYVDDAHLGPALWSLDKIKHDSYYVKMAAAWAVSMYYLLNPCCTEAFLKQCSLDDFTYHKALQKVCESNRADSAVKMRMRAMKQRDV